MELIRGIYNWRSRHYGCVATLGNFDGVHHGHQMLLAHLNAKRDELRLPSTLVTFEPLPDEFFGRDQIPPRLSSIREKLYLLQRSGVDRVLLLHFNKRLRTVEAEEVIEDFLVRRMGVGYVVVGDDFRFGARRRGDYAMLQAAGERFGFGVSHMGTLTFEHERVSSTRIRELLGEGDFDKAEKLLGYPYFMMGRVTYGRQLGRQLGVPTANIRMRRRRWPVDGVFAVENHLEDGRIFHGVANVGLRPTVDGSKPMIETHLFDFDGDLYGRLLRVVFRRKLRDERKFESLDALRAQIARDVSTARELLEV